MTVKIPLVTGNKLNCFYQYNGNVIKYFAQSNCVVVVLVLFVLLFTC